ncbi:MAG: hypothetical protein ACPL4K_03805, partial [Candidatus Margulisiibacteriota bacterium]
MGILKVAFIIIMLLTLSSCAFQNRTTPVSNEVVGSEEAEVVESPSREAVFVYGNPKDLPKRLVLTLGSEPLLLPSGYVRLVGVVSGGKPTAC